MLLYLNVTDLNAFFTLQIAKRLSNYIGGIELHLLENENHALERDLAPNTLA